MTQLSSRVAARWLHTAGSLADAGQAAVKVLGEKINLKERVEEGSNSVSIPLSSGKTLVLQVK